MTLRFKNFVTTVSVLSSLHLSNKMRGDVRRGSKIMLLHLWTTPYVKYKLKMMQIINCFQKIYMMI